MNHPTDLLADLVAGRLDEPGRSQVLEHVHGCPACSAEVRAAAAAREALRGLPEPNTPPGLGDAAVRAARDAAPTASDRSRLWAGLAVAAVIVLAVAVALPRLGGDDGPTLAAESAAVADASAGPVRLEVLDRDFDLESVKALADEMIAEQPLLAAATASGEAGASAPEAADGATGNALACLRAAFETLPGSTVPLGAPLRLLEARFDGSPAYLGVFAQGPGAGQPADTLYVLAATRPDCTGVSSSRFVLPAE